MSVSSGIISPHTYLAAFIRCRPFFPLACAALSMVHRPTCHRIHLLCLQVDRLALVQFIRLLEKKPLPLIAGRLPQYRGGTPKW